MANVNQKKSVLNGITVLGITGIICKLIGVLFRIPLAWLIGDEGLGIYQMVFPTYAMLLTISSAGLPVAISRMISYSLAENDPRNAHKTFKIALYVLAIIGLITTLLMVAGSNWLALRVGDEKTKLGFIAIAPSLLLVCVMSAFRGYTQGHSDMQPTAISQLVEQVGKVAFALPLAYLGARVDIGFAAAGALLGTSIAEFFALIYIYFKYKNTKKNFVPVNQDLTRPLLSSKAIIKRLASLAIPITLGACVIPFAGFVDSAMLVNRLRSIGFTLEQARSAFGLYSGLVITLINVPTALAVAISMSLVPAISSAMAVNNYDSIARQCNLGIRYAFIIGLPSSLGMSLLAKELLHFFYSSLGADNIQLAANLLEISSFTIVLFTVVQATSGILQGLNKSKIPMYTLAIGVVLKIIINYTLVGVPEVNIFGAPIASLICYTVSTIPNLYYVSKYGKVKFDFMNYIVRPGAATLTMGVVVYLLKMLLPFNRLTTIILLLVGVIVYVASAIVFKALNKNDLNMLKRGKRA